MRIYIQIIRIRRMMITSMPKTKRRLTTAYKNKFIFTILVTWVSAVLWCKDWAESTFITSPTTVRFLSFHYSWLDAVYFSGGMHLLYANPKTVFTGHIGILRPQNQGDSQKYIFFLLNANSLNSCSTELRLSTVLLSRSEPAFFEWSRSRNCMRPPHN